MLNTIAENDDTDCVAKPTREDVSLLGPKLQKHSSKARAYCWKVNFTQNDERSSRMSNL